MCPLLFNTHYPQDKIQTGGYGKPEPSEFEPSLQADSCHNLTHDPQIIFLRISSLNVSFLLLLGDCTCRLPARVAFLPAYIWLTSIYPSRSSIGHQVLKEALSSPFPHNTGCDTPLVRLHSILPYLLLALNILFCDCRAGL